MKKNCGPWGRNFYITALVAVFLLSSVNGAFAQTNSPTLRVAVSIPPMQEWVQRIAGNRVAVTLIMPPGSSPHSFEPSPKQLVELSSAQIWFVIGVDFEYSLVPKVRAMYPKLSIVDVTKNITFRTLRPGEQETDASPTGGPVNPALTNRDQHSWLGYEQAKIEIAAIRDELIARDPSGAALYRSNYNSYMKEIDATYAKLKAELAPLAGENVFVYHPAFGYFFDMFKITQVAVELGGKEPTQKELMALIELAKKDKARAIFTQIQFSESAAKAVASAIGAAVVPIDPLAGDWLANLSRMGQALLKALPGAK